MSAPIHATSLEKDQQGKWHQTFEDPEFQVTTWGCFIRFTAGDRAYEFWIDEAEAIVNRLSMVIAQAKDYVGE